MNVRIFAKTIEDEALAQIQKMSSSDAYKGCEIRIMPDCHAGKGCTIGTVIKIGDRVVPNTVGVDIGCGMSAYYLGYDDINLEEIDRSIRANVPSGFNIHNKPVVEWDALHALRCKSVVDIDMANRSIGTLGGGNHFIEINKTSDGENVLVIHSGSRNLGLRVCNYYQKIAESKCFNKKDIIQSTIDRLKSEGREKDIRDEIKKLSLNNIDKELAYLEGDDMSDYLHDMLIVQKYASLNRMHIAKAICGKAIPDIETIHNYIDIDNGILRKAYHSYKHARWFFDMQGQGKCRLVVFCASWSWAFNE